MRSAYYTHKFADRQTELREVPKGSNTPHNRELARRKISDAISGEKLDWAKLRPGLIIRSYDRTGAMPGVFLCVSESNLCRLAPPVRGVTVVELPSVAQALEMRDKYLAVEAATEEALEQQVVMMPHA